MDYSPRSSGRGQQYNHSRSAILDLFNLYLVRNDRQRPEDSSLEPPNKTQKRIIAPNRELPPPNEQFLLDFGHLRSQFADQEQFRLMTESVIVSLVLQCCSHAPQAEFLLFALRCLCSMPYIHWDTFLPSLLSSVASAGQGNQAVNVLSSTNLHHSRAYQADNSAPSNSNFQTLNPTSPLSLAPTTGSPAQSVTEHSTCVNMSPLKSSETSYSVEQATGKFNLGISDVALHHLRHLCCRIILTGLEFNLKPDTCADILCHMLNWIIYWDQKLQVIDDSQAVKSYKPDMALKKCLQSCLEVMWSLVKEDKCRVPFYELLRGDLQFIQNTLSNEALFSLVLEVHRRRDMMAIHMQMLDQHLHCPTFGTQRLLSQATFNMSNDAALNMRYSPITYLSVLGEPLHGEDLASTIEKGSLDWERALRCMRHALHANPSPDWWKRVLILAPCNRPKPQMPIPGAVFTSEMICEATIDRIVELLKLINSEVNFWDQWLSFTDLFYFIMKSGCIDFADFVDKLVTRVTDADDYVLQSNHVTWLFAQIIRVDVVMNCLTSDPRKMETTRKMTLLHREDNSSDLSPQAILLDYISSCQSLRIWSLNTSTREYLSNEQLQKGKQIDEWWRQALKADTFMDYMNLDDGSIGMLWVVSYTMTQPACEMLVNLLSSAGAAEWPPSSVQPNEKVMVMRESSPLPISLLSGLSIHLCVKLAFQLEDSLFSVQVLPSIAMVETYVRVLLLAPHSLFRSHFNHLSQRNPSLLSKPYATLLVLEILNYRLLPLYRYAGKSKLLMQDVTKIVSALKGKRGDHRVFRLAENLCMNIIFSMRDFFLIKKEGKGPTELTETLNRLIVVSLAITVKTRGISEAEHVSFLQTMLEQIMASSQHVWSEKTLSYFPPILRDVLIRRVDNRSFAIQAWIQEEATVINQCTQLLSPSADPTYAVTYLSHSFPQHRRYLCTGAWILMQAHPENINSANLARVLREFCPEEVTVNIYTMVDVLLHLLNIELQRGHSLQDLLLKACANIGFLIWTHELLPLDVLLLALVDRDDDPHALLIVMNLLDRQELQQRVKLYCINRGPPEHWSYNGPFKRVELQKSLGNHLSWKDRYPTFFDDIAGRLLPVIPLIIYRLIENDATDAAERVLGMYSQLLAYHPFRFTFVRDILAYFYGHLPVKLILRILNLLDINRIPFSESFPQHISSSNPVVCPPLDYFATLLLGLVNNVLPPLSGSSKITDTTARNCQSKSQQRPGNVLEGQKAFYQVQDPGTYTQLVLETAVIELLSLPVPAHQIVSSFIQIVVGIQSTLIQSGNSLCGTSSGSVLPTSPSGGSSDSMAARSSASVSGINTSNFALRNGYSLQQLSCLLIQASGLLLSQLPPEFHVTLYVEASRVIKESWWLSDSKRSLSQDWAVSYALLDPVWAAQDGTSTAIGNIIALLHSLLSNLPQEWLEGAHIIIKHLRPVTSVAMLRVLFRVISPLLPRLANAHTLFNKTLSLLLNAIGDVFGRTSQPASRASEIVDIVDFLHHVVHYQGQGGPVLAASKPRVDVLAICGRALEGMRPDVQRLLSHLTTDTTTSIYAATHPNLVLNPS